MKQRKHEKYPCSDCSALAAEQFSPEYKVNTKNYTAGFATPQYYLPQKNTLQKIAPRFARNTSLPSQNTHNWPPQKKCRTQKTPSYWVTVDFKTPKKYVEDAEKNSIKNARVNLDENTFSPQKNEFNSARRGTRAVLIPGIWILLPVSKNNIG